MEEQREVCTQEGHDLSGRLNCPFLETSALSRFNVEEAFSNVVREIRRWRYHGGEDGDALTTPLKKRGRCEIT